MRRRRKEPHCRQQQRSQRSRRPRPPCGRRRTVRCECSPFDPHPESCRACVSNESAAAGRPFIFAASRSARSRCRARVLLHAVKHGPCASFDRCHRPRLPVAGQILCSLWPQNKADRWRRGSTVDCEAFAPQALGLGDDGFAWPTGSSALTTLAPGGCALGDSRAARRFAFAARRSAIGPFWEVPGLSPGNARCCTKPGRYAGRHRARGAWPLRAASPRRLPGPPRVTGAIARPPAAARAKCSGTGAGKAPMVRPCSRNGHEAVPGRARLVLMAHPWRIGGRRGDPGTRTAMSNRGPCRCCRRQRRLGLRGGAVACKAARRRAGDADRTRRVHQRHFASGARVAARLVAP